MGFVVFMVMGVYLLISLGVVTWAVGHAKKNGKSVKKWGWGAALVMFLIPFWDWLPTVAVHQYYCAKDSGFWVYKTLDQWKAENPGVMLTEDKTTQMRRVGDDENHIDTQVLNQRFRWLREKRQLIPQLPIYAVKHEIEDVNSGVVARHIDFASGKGRDYLKFWMNVPSCPNGTENGIALYHFVDLIVNMNKGAAK